MAAASAILARRLQEVFGGDSDDEEGDEAPQCRRPGFGMAGGEQGQMARGFPGGDPCALRSAPVTRRWEEAGFVKGLWICAGFLSAEQQEHALGCIHEECWFRPPTHNQHMRFGELPRVAEDLSRLVHQAVCSFRESRQGGQPGNSTGSADSCSQATLACGDARQSSSDVPLGSGEGSVASQFWEARPGGSSCRAGPGVERSSAGPFPEALLGREPLFDQMIANWYAPDQGIRAHMDLLRFDDGIAIVSLLSPCVMSFARAPTPEPCPKPSCTTANSAQAPLANTAVQSSPLHLTQQPFKKQAAEANTPTVATGAQMPLQGWEDGDPEGQALLRPGDLLLLSGEARYLWTHAIVRDAPHQHWAGGRISCQERISITLRKLVAQED